MKTFTKHIILSLIVLAVVSCRGLYEDNADKAADYKKMVKFITVKDLNDKIEKGETFLLIDVRQTADYATGNIPGSVSVLRGDLEFNMDNVEFWASQYMYPPEKTDTIIVYCNDGNNGILSAVTLMKLGYNHVYNLEGGYKAFNPNQDPNAAPKTSGGCGG